MDADIGIAATRTSDTPPLIDAALVTRLVAAQFPQWADLPVRPVEPGGWDNRTFHLGEKMTVRLPSRHEYAAQVNKEHRWLPLLAPHLPLPIPTPLAMGAPAEGYPFDWSVYRWLDGETTTLKSVQDLSEFATTLTGFLNALQRIDATGGPPPGEHNFFRGGPLETYDADTRRAIDALHEHIPSDVASAVWDAAVRGAWHDPPVWVHGDVAAGNLLVRGGRLAAVIDFGCCGVGDPACDLAIAWTLLSGTSREAFRSVLRVDPATWARGRGWALWKALVTLERHIGTDAMETVPERRVLNELLRDR